MMSTGYLPIMFSQDEVTFIHKWTHFLILFAESVLRNAMKLFMKQCCRNQRTWKVVYQCMTLNQYDMRSYKCIRASLKYSCRPDSFRLQSAACSLDQCQEEMAEDQAWSCLKPWASARSARGGIISDCTIASISQYVAKFLFFRFWFSCLQK